MEEKIKRINSLLEQREKIKYVFDRMVSGHYIKICDGDGHDLLGRSQVVCEIAYKYLPKIIDETKAALEDVDNKLSQLIK